MTRYPFDRCSYSLLKTISDSPAHFLHACTVQSQPTASMRLGTIVHRLVLGGPNLLVWDGTRRGRAWDEFQLSATGEIFTRSEVDAAQPIADSVMRSPVAREVLDGARYEVPLEWEQHGIPFATRGVDILGHWLADLKTTKCARPDKFEWDARRMHYPEQIALYDWACMQNGIIVRRHGILAVETAPPYCVTMLELPKAVLDQARAKIALWCERVRACAQAGEWPGYVQSTVMMSAGPVEIEGADELDEITE